MTRTLRRARVEDYDDVAAFTGDTWSDRDFDDYLPDVFEAWACAEERGETDRQRTLVAEVDGTVVGLCNAVMVTDWEGWLEGMRMHPAHRGRGIARDLTEAQFDWCRDQGAAVVRNLVFDWNAAGMGQSRAVGFEPTAICRWVQPEPEAAPGPADTTAREDADGAWSYWSGSDVRSAMAGLAFDPAESWALSTLTREHLERLAGDERVLAVGESRTHGMAVRSRVERRDIEDGSTQSIAVYGAAAWADLPAAKQLFDAIRTDAAAIDADATRVCVPETARCLADASAARAPPDDTAMVVLSADLSRR